MLQFNNQTERIETHAAIHFKLDTRNLHRLGSFLFQTEIRLECIVKYGLIALLDPYLSKSCGYGPLTNLNTKQPPMF